MKLIAQGKVTDGVLKITHRREFDRDLTNFEGKTVVVTIEKLKRKRSLSQNAYYFGVVLPICKEALNDVGYRLTTEVVHEYLKGQFNITEIVNERNGEILKAVGSTTEMSTSQMMDFFAKITEWAAEYLNVQIPQPNEQLSINLNP